MARPKSTTYYQTEIPDISISFDPTAFDAAVRSHGVKLEHWQAMRCPIGMTDLDDNQRSHPDHSGCSNGFLYTRIGNITSLFTSNSTKQEQKDLGLVDGSSVVATFPRGYDDCDSSFYPAQFDRFYLAEESIVVPTWQLTQTSPSGIDRLNFPIVKVEKIIDSRGVEYKQGDDFSICNGSIKWIPGRHRPTYDLETSKPGIYSIRYLYRPYYYCGTMLHEIRVAQIDSPINSDRSLVRMPQSATLHREWCFRNEANDTQARNPQSPRQEPHVNDGGF
jgi:hypothetical protein